MYQILRGLVYIHSAKVIHRDLKPGNLLVNKACGLKICDFGLSRGFINNNNMNLVLTEYVVTRWYRAPDVILNASDYTTAIDIWSVGCIFAEMMGRQPLLQGKDYLDQIRRTVTFLGNPSNEDLEFINNENAKKFVTSLPKTPPLNLSQLFPKATPLALDLLSKML